MRYITGERARVIRVFTVKEMMSVNTGFKEDIKTEFKSDIISRLLDLRFLDFSAQNVPDSSYSDLDDLERERLRNIIRNYRGETALLELDNESLDKALRLATVNDGKLIPTYCGMLFIGKIESIKTYDPAFERVYPSVYQNMRFTFK